jgi:hypothetical protein
MIFEKPPERVPVREIPRHSHRLGPFKISDWKSTQLVPHNSDPLRIGDTKSKITPDNAGFNKIYWEI